MTKIYGVGLGPGDPGLVTLAALRAITSAQLILAPSSQPRTIGRAERIVRDLLPDREVVSVPMPMTGGTTGITQREDATRTLIRDLRPRLMNTTVAFVTLGDPLIYSTFSLFVASLHHEQVPIVVEVIPGIPAFGQLASLTTTNLVDNDERLHLVPATGGLDHVARLLEDRESVLVLYKLSANFAAIRAMIIRAGRLEGTMVGMELGTERVQVLALSEAPEVVGYFATIIVPVQRRQG
ncbi:precorrin-2 C(20)-methyltransferase [Ferrimicrobium sp.]|uniref:precorrin-2 C(20)-methyltransferase n=1 Tax=Ferrimicrobium sp. TaxID=2926050 RepID=UPI002634B103|nr:precorrin-2 C(20)-methyltransferase [Ferrimicrobium sp.]